MTTTVNFLGLGALPDDAPERETPWAPHVNNATGDDAARCVDALIATMEANPLDPSFDNYGCFCEPLGGGVVRFWGNFLAVAAVFSVDSDDDETCDRLFAAIRKNRKRADFIAARAEQQECDRNKRDAALRRAEVSR